LVLRNIHRSADDSLQGAILNNGNTNATDISNFAVGSHNPLGDITSRSFRHHFLDKRSYELAILRMDKGEVFLKAGGFLGRIKTVYAEKFTRPVAEETRRIKCPTSHVGEALSFAEIMLTLAQFLR